MTRMGNSEEQEEESGGAGAGGKTVLVGVNLDSESKELLTWALVKVAQPGDRVIALHVLKDPVEARSGGKSSVVCLVNTFDSVISVYEGFCNLKQVDLKVKISRGSSLRKTLVQEAKEFGALTVIIGVTKSTRIGSSVSVARYCARQLSNICSVLAVSNGKVLFKREASGEKCRGDLSRRARIFGVIHRTLALSPKSMSSGSDDASTNEGSGKNSDFEACSESGDSPHCCCKASSGSTDLVSSTNIHEDSLATADAFELNIQRKTCQICMMDLHGQKQNNGSGDHDKKGFLAYEPYASDSSSTEDHNNPLELPPSLKLEAASSSMSLLMREMPELRSGWPHLRRKILPKRRTSDSMKQIPVVQWAAQLPSRYTAALNSKSSPVNTNTSTAAIDKVHASIGGKESDQFGNAEGELQKDYHKELQTFCEKHASTCRLFSYEELASATSQFSAENLIGNGGNSRVYRGHLSDGKELAIKILKPSDDAWKEFILEIEIVTSVNHENIVSLVGCCFRGSKFLLVYNFVPGGSLEESLHGSKGKALSWTDRCKVAIGVAKALDYLHNDNSHPIVHRDVKSSNVLLSEAFEPQFLPTTLTLDSSVTRPPPLLSESDLLGCMDKAGIGTDATMHDHIKKLLDRFYAVKDSNTRFSPTNLGEALVMGYDEMGYELWKPYLRSAMESDMKSVSVGTKRKAEVLESCLQQMKACFLDARVQKGKLMGAMEIFFERSNRNNTDDNHGETVRSCTVCQESEMVLRRKPDGNYMVGCLRFPLCRNVVWLPGAIAEAHVSENICTTCTPGPVFKIQFKFRRMEIPPTFNVDHLGCIGGCDEILLELIETCGTGSRNPSAAPAQERRRVVPPTRNPPARSSRQVACTHCRQVGHSASDCPALVGGPPTASGSNLGRSEILCDACQMPCVGRTANTSNNRGRKFYTCQSRDCNFFVWEDNLQNGRVGGGSRNSNSSNRSQRDNRAGRGRGRGRQQERNAGGSFVMATGEPTERRCFVCGDPSHFANVCPNRG